MSRAGYSIGVDYGTNSVRAIVVDVGNGRELGTWVYGYPSGTAGILLDGRDVHVARQRPSDYIKGLHASVKGALAEASKVRGFDSGRVIGIGVDTTGSTPMPVDAAGRALADDAKWRNNLAAQAWLWKDHTGHAEAVEITELARRSGSPYLSKCGGIYSSEWFWSKVLHCARTSPEVFEAAHSWVECCDYIPAYLTGARDPLKMSRSICAAGHKAMYSEEWGGLPSKAFLRQLSPKLAELRDRLYEKAYAADHRAGVLDAGVARKLGLPAGIAVATGAFDAHMGAVGAGVRPGRLVKIMGTSSCDMMVWPAGSALADIPGVCGIVPGSVVPGMHAIEAGQSAVGDIFNWFVTHLCPPEYAGPGAHEKLTRAAAKLCAGESGLLALDWNNGNRTVLIDALLTGLLVGQTLHTSAAEVYRALVEATAFGALVIVERIESYGVKIDEVVTCGGVAEKNPLLMQIYADVLNRPIRTSRSKQTCALGAALFGAVVGGAYAKTEQAQAAMSGLNRKVYEPRAEATEVYGRLYRLYMKLHDAFGMPGGGEAGVGEVMKQLIALRDEVRRG